MLRLKCLHPGETKTTIASLNHSVVILISYLSVQWELFSWTLFEFSKALKMAKMNMDGNDGWQDGWNIQGSMC